MDDGGLTQDFDAHALFTFAEIPDAPPLANRWARTKRWFVIALTESWLAVWLYRAKMRLRASGAPLLPGACDVLARVLFHVQIGDRVSIGRGLMITHGNVVIDGQTTIGRDCQINPWVTIGLSNSRRLGFSVEGPTIGDHVHIGTGAKVLGPVRVGDYARIGANAVVVHDVPANTTVVGVPARPVATGARLPDSHDTAMLTAMRDAIIAYRLHRQSLRALVDALHDGFAAASDELRPTEASVKDELIFLDAVAASGSEESGQVDRAIDAVEAALTRAP